MSSNPTRRQLSSATAGGGSSDQVPTSAGRRGWLIALVGLGVVAIGGGIVAMQGGGRRDPVVGNRATQFNVPAKYDSVRAFGYLKQICAIGPRVSGTEGMAQQQVMLSEFFRGRGATVELQAFPARHPLTGQQITLGNLIARFGVDRPKRFLLCAHYDTRPFPDRDPVNPRGVFLGANDGGSGVAALMEWSHHFDELPPDVGVDIVLFDAEELVYDNNRDAYFLGSTHFAREYLAAPPKTGYQAGILLDMVGDAEQHFFIEQNSWRYARPVVREVWATASRLGVNSFHSRIQHEVRDDHLPLNTIAKIPTIDIIDFDYPRPSNRGYSYWHTQQDVPENCSGNSLVAVVYVVHEWLRSK